MKVAGERVGGNSFTHTASVATSTKSKMKVASERVSGERLWGYGVMGLTTLLWVMGV